MPGDDESSFMSPTKVQSASAINPATPATSRTIRVADPSPNRTEAAAAMLNLLAAPPASQDLVAHTPAQPQETKAASTPVKKRGSSAKRKLAKPPVKKPKAQSKKTSKKVAGSGKDEVNGLNDSMEHCVMSGNESETSAKKTKKKWTTGQGVQCVPYREYSRKDKSLGLLVENFLKLYEASGVSEICLDHAAQELDVGRRRIYDIVNILESIHLVSRRSKSWYNWHGLEALPTSTSAMKELFAEMKRASNSLLVENGRRRERGSLCKLSRMFVELFLEEENCIIPLDDAAKQLVEEDDDTIEDRALKTKTRRLYDVANVLVSVGLIEKVRMPHTRKPSFRWKHRSGAPVLAEERLTQPEEEMETADDVEMKSHAVEPDAAVVTSQSCGSDIVDDAKETEARKRPLTSETHATDASPQVEAWKRVKVDHDGVAPQMLRFNPATHSPVHPNVVLEEEQTRVSRYLENYIREYVDYTGRGQVREGEPSTQLAEWAANMARDHDRA